MKIVETLKKKYRTKINKVCKVILGYKKLDKCINTVFKITEDKDILEINFITKRVRMLGVTFITDIEFMNDTKVTMSKGLRTNEKFKSKEEEDIYWSKF